MYIVIVLLGNKVDLIEKLEVDKEDGVALAKENECMFYLTSAKMDIGIFEAFDEAIQEYVNVYGIESLMRNSDRSKINNKEEKDSKESKCC